MPCNKRKRIQCRGSETLESTGASPNKKSTVEDAGGEGTRSRRPESTRETADDDTVSGNTVPSSGDESAFTQESATFCGSSDAGFLSGGGREGICETRGASGSLEAEISGKAVEEATGSHCEGSVPCAPEMRLIRLKNVDPNSPVSNVRILLSTGLLEGLPVTYRSDSYKVRINGFIKDLGYLCGCSSCKYTKSFNCSNFLGKFSFKGFVQFVHVTFPCITLYFMDFVLNNSSQVLSALEFERHSGAASKNQNNHILLENGKSLYNVVKELAGAGLRLGSLQSVIEEVIGRPPNWKWYKAWKESFQIENHGAKNICPKIDERRSSQPNMHHEDQIVRRSRSLDLHNTLEATIDNPNTQPSNSAQACTKKRDSALHSVIFTESGLPDGAELAYCARGKKVLEGYKLGSGILCNCCRKEGLIPSFLLVQISPSQFEAHAGWATRRQPYRHIFTSNVCLGLSRIPDGEWCCTYCKDELPSGVVATDARMAVRVRRIIVAPSLETGCCSICRRNNFSCNDSFNEETVIICDQCEKEYHVGCLRSSGSCDLQALPKGNWFCCSSCLSIHDSLREIAFHGVNIVPDILTNQLKVKLQEKCLMNESGFDVRWQLLSGKIRSPVNKFLLSKAFEIFDEGFEPITERSGRNLIPAMVYGRNMGGHELGGMYCAILTANSVVVSAGIIRIFGNDVAEMPLVATKQENQGKFQKLA
ncbi:hypothetical protein Taro_007094, partial [Colocasia esculenta]|nr:hypothetical protein [Colocasia esculenta]